MNNFLSFKAIPFNVLMKEQGSVPKIGVNGDELKMHCFPGSLTVKVYTNIALNSIFTMLFAGGKVITEDELVTKATPLLLEQFGNEDKASAKLSILHGISYFKNYFPECGITKHKLALVA